MTYKRPFNEPAGVRASAIISSAQLKLFDSLVLDNANNRTGY